MYATSFSYRYLSQFQCSQSDLCLFPSQHQLLWTLKSAPSCMKIYHFEIKSSKNFLERGHNPIQTSTLHLSTPSFGALTLARLVLGLPLSNCFRRTINYNSSRQLQLSPQFWRLCRPTCNWVSTFGCSLRLLKVNRHYFEF